MDFHVLFPLILLFDGPPSASQKIDWPSLLALWKVKGEGGAKNGPNSIWSGTRQLYMRPSCCHPLREHPVRLSWRRAGTMNASTTAEKMGVAGLTPERQRSCLPPQGGAQLAQCALLLAHGAAQPQTAHTSFTSASQIFSNLRRLWPSLARPSLAKSKFGQIQVWPDQVWPRPSLARTKFGQTIVLLLNGYIILKE